MFTDINPEVLVWARKESGYRTPETVAQKLNIKVEQLIEWETEGKSVDFEILELIAKTYKRQTAIFFLPDVPQRIKKPKDHRNFAIDSSDLSPETLLAIRRTSRYLQTTRDLGDAKFWSKKYEWLKEFTGKVNLIKKEALLLRKILEAPIDLQVKETNSDFAFRFWRNRIEEKLNIFVFQFAIPNDEMDGFSYTLDGLPYAIVVDSKRQAARKIFTLFHELAHIFRRESGICITNFADSKTQKQEEFDCNNFAGQFLVPNSAVKKYDTSEDIYEAARLLNVSSEVYLRRIYDSGLLEENYFYELLNQIREKTSEYLRRRTVKKQSGGPSRIIQSRSSRGSKFFNLVTDAAQGGRITFSTASDLLGLKIGSIRA